MRRIALRGTNPINWIEDWGNDVDVSQKVSDLSDRATMQLNHIMRTNELSENESVDFTWSLILSLFASLIAHHQDVVTVFSDPVTVPDPNSENPWLVEELRRYAEQGVATDDTRIAAEWAISVLYFTRRWLRKILSMKSAGTAPTIARIALVESGLDGQQIIKTMGHGVAARLVAELTPFIRHHTGDAEKDHEAAIALTAAIGAILLRVRSDVDRKALACQLSMMLLSTDDSIRSELKDQLEEVMEKMKVLDR